MLLAIDTSTHRASVAIHDGERLRAEITWLAEQNHTRTLLPSIEKALALAGTTLDEAECIAVALGPGSFNGLRVGLTTAKGFCLALSVRLVAVPTLEIIAAEYDLDEPVMNAGRGLVYRWRRSRGTPASQIELVEGVAPDYVRHAGTLADLGWERFRKRRFADPMSIEPLYVHPPQIHGRAAAGIEHQAAAI